MVDFLNLVQAIKEPAEYNPYEFTYQSIRSRDDYFNQTCLAGIKTIHITMQSMSTFYFPIAAAILRKENSNRKKVNKELWKIKFYHVAKDLPSYDRMIKRIAQQINPNILIGNIIAWHGYFEKEIPANEENVAFHIYDDYRYLSNSDCSLSKEHKSFKYRISRLHTSDDDPRWPCWNNEETKKMKTFTTPLDLEELMNEDLCRK